MNQNISRNGNFTSSEIFTLMTLAKDGKSFGKPALTYIDECNMERRLGRSLTDESNARPLTWGKLLEKRCFDLLTTEYRLSSLDTLMHPTITYWAGSPDGNKFDEGGTVIDIKCPLTLKSFCQLVDSKDIGELRDNHKDGEKFYWQLVSNAILTDCNHAELIVYVPYLKELNEIRELTQNYEGNPNKVAWINWAEDNEIPYLIEGGHYKNINIIRFGVPQSDKDLLTERVLKAGELLIKVPELVAA
jgi:hypothetical protein